MLKNFVENFIHDKWNIDFVEIYFYLLSIVSLCMKLLIRFSLYTIKEVFSH